MENTTSRNLIWKLSAVVAALALVVGILIYTGGYENFLKLLGIKAGTEQSIIITTVDQMLGASGDSWLVPGSTAEVDGVSVVESSDFVPSDPDGNGLVTSLFSSEDGSENSYSKHSYATPVIDLGSEAPQLAAVVITQRAAVGASLQHSYQTASTPEGIDDASEVTMEVAAAEDGQIDQAIAQIGVPVSRYLRLKVEMNGDDFANRSAVYGWDIQHGQVTSNDEVVVEPIDPTPPQIRYATHIDFSEAAVMPAVVNMSIYGGEAAAQPVWSDDGKSKSALTPVYDLPIMLAPGNYFLVMEAIGYRTQVVPFASGEASIDAKVANFVPVEMSFDLNGDGGVNTLDVTLLLGKIAELAKE